MEENKIQRVRSTKHLKPKDQTSNSLSGMAMPSVEIYKINAFSSNARVELFDGPDIPNKLTKLK